MTKERYQYIKAIRDGEELRWEYQLAGTHSTGHMLHDEDMARATDDEVRELTAIMLDVPADNQDVITVEHV